MSDVGDTPQFDTPTLAMIAHQNTPQFDTPTLAMIAHQMHDRPIWQIRDAVPLAVDRDTWNRAEREMREAMKLQGRDVSAAAWAPLPNFLLHGIPVVMNDAQD